MSLNALDSLLQIGKSAIERIWPDPMKRAEEMRKLEELYQKGDLAELNAYVQITLAQIEVNNTSAKSKSTFVAGARPFIIWVGGFSLAFAALVHPLLNWVWAFVQAFGGIDADLVPPAYTEPATLSAVVTGLLGVAGMRSYDKSKGTQTDRIKEP